MTIIIKYIIGISLAIVTLLSCDTSKSLQSYIVEKQDDNRFMKVDFATSLMSELDSLPEEQKQVLAAIKKMNVVAYPKKEGSQADFDMETKRVSFIFDQERYQVLGSFKANNQNVTLMYLGKEDAIDEVIVYAIDNDKGFAIFRLLGNNMNPSDILKLSGMLEKGNIDLSKLTGLEAIFNE
jgi:hypothetical protein